MGGHQRSRRGKTKQQNQNKANKTQQKLSTHVPSPEVLQGAEVTGVELAWHKALCARSECRLKITVTRAYLGKPFTEIIQGVFSLAS